MASERPHPPHSPSRDDEHLDALVLLRLADGEPVAPAAQAHAAACVECGARLSALRQEGDVVAGALALDAAELALLQQAALPAHVAAYAPALRRTALAERETLGSLASVLLATGAAYVLWRFTLPLLLGAAETARWVGATALLANLLAGWLIGAVQTLWNAFLAVGDLPWIDAPALPMLALALLLWLAAAVLPAPGRQGSVIPGATTVY